MNKTLKWALVGGLSLGGFDLLLGCAAILDFIRSGWYQIANLPAIMIHAGSASSIEDSLLIWVPQMAAIGFVGGAILRIVVALTSAFSGRPKTRSAEH